MLNLIVVCHFAKKHFYRQLWLETISIIDQVQEWYTEWWISIGFIRTRRQEWSFAIQKLQFEFSGAKILINGRVMSRQITL